MVSTGGPPHHPAASGSRAPALRTELSVGHAGRADLGPASVVSEDGLTVRPAAASVVHPDVRAAGRDLRSHPGSGDRTCQESGPIRQTDRRVPSHQAQVRGHGHPRAGRGQHHLLRRADGDDDRIKATIRLPHVGGRLRRCRRSAFANVRANVQIHGAMGFTVEDSAHRFVKRTHTLCATESFDRAAELLGGLPSAETSEEV